MKKLADFIGAKVDKKYQVYEAICDEKSVEVAVPIETTKEFEAKFAAGTDAAKAAESLGGFVL